MNIIRISIGRNNQTYLITFKNNQLSHVCIGYVFEQDEIYNVCEKRSFKELIKACMKSCRPNIRKGAIQKIRYILSEYVRTPADPTPWPWCDVNINFQQSQKDNFRIISEVLILFSMLLIKIKLINYVENLNLVRIVFKNS
jgi:hypothetical protein